MNTKNLNATSENFASQEGQDSVAQSPRLSSEGSVQMPAKSGKSLKKAKDAFRTISEVADKLDVQQHVLRFWETKFSQVRPLKRGGGRRYYRPEDVALLERIHHLLYTEGYTIKGVQKLLKEQGKARIIASSTVEVAAKPKAQTTVSAPSSSEASKMAQAPQKKAMSAQQRAMLEIMLAELKAMRAMIKV